MKRTLTLLLTLMMVSGGIAVAQEPAPTPEATPGVTVDNGGVIVLAPAPVDIPETVAEEVATQTADDLQNFAEGEINRAELTRDAANTVDMGEGWEFLLFGMIFAGGVAPLISILVEKSKMDSRLGAPVGFLATVAFYVAMYFLFHESSPNLPQHPLAWIMTGLSGAFSGLVAKAGYRSATSNGGGK